MKPNPETEVPPAAGRIEIEDGEAVSAEAASEAGKWARMPAAGAKLFGLGRTTLYNLSNAGAIQIVSVRRSGKETGVTLVYLPSLAGYLERLRREQNPQGLDADRL